MGLNRRNAEAENLLRACGAERMEHPGGTLFEHLVRVRALLAEWGSSEHVELAGLCHAAYGTDGFDSALLRPDQRAMLADTIGSDA